MQSSTAFAPKPGSAGRANQRRRTRKALLEAATRLMKRGRTPTLEEAAEEALVSRATAYRYFPNAEALMVEAVVDVAVPDADRLFGADAREDPVARVTSADDALDEVMRANEAPLRLMLAQSVRAMQGENDPPPRQNRRTPLIEAALAPARDQFTPNEYRRLTQALALILGAESMIVFKDVLQVDDAEARRTKRWAIRVLIEAARKKRTA